MRSAQPPGMRGESHQGATDLYALPSERSLAASHVHRNHGWRASRETNCCPTTPVAPRTPTSIASIEVKNPLTASVAGDCRSLQNRLMVRLISYERSPPAPVLARLCMRFRVASVENIYGQYTSRPHPSRQAPLLCISKSETL